MNGNNQLTPQQQVELVSRRILGVDLTQHSPLIPAEVNITQINAALMEVWRLAEITGYQIGYGQGVVETRDAIYNRVDEI